MGDNWLRESNEHKAKGDFLQRKSIPTKEQELHNSF